MYTITCQATDKIVFYLIRKISFFKMKENYEIYLNYTPWKCPFIIKDLTKIIEHYAEHGFNKTPNNGILIGNLYCNIKKNELVLENSKLLRKHTKKYISTEQTVPLRKLYYIMKMAKDMANTYHIMQLDN